MNWVTGATVNVRKLQGQSENVEFLKCQVKEMTGGFNALMSEILTVVIVHQRIGRSLTTFRSGPTNVGAVTECINLMYNIGVM